AGTVPGENWLNAHPNYSTVSGTLPLEELPVMEMAPDGQFSFAQFEIEVLTPGEVVLDLGDDTGIQAWAGEKEIAIENGKMTVSLAQGKHRITLAVDRRVRA